MKERRKYKRTALITYSRVYDRDTGEFLGYVCDMSPSGLMTINQDKVAPERKAILRIEVPPLPLPAKDWLVLPARAVWSQDDAADPEKFNTGWQFLATTPEDQEIIAAILQHYDLYENAF